MIRIGYVDGLWRTKTKENLLVEVNNQFVPVIGRICKDQCMIDFNDLNNVQVGIQVIVYGLTPKNSIDSIAERNSTINYKIVCTLGEESHECIEKIK